MFDLTDKAPLSFAEYGACTMPGTILNGDDIWSIIRNGQTVQAKFITGIKEEPITDIFRLSEIHAINPISKFGEYKLRFHLVQRYFEILEDTVPAPCAIEGHILMLSDPTHEGNTDIYQVTGDRIKAALYRTYCRGQIMDIEYYMDGELTKREYVSFPNDSARNWLIDDKQYLIFIENGVAKVKPYAEEK